MKKTKPQKFSKKLYDSAFKQYSEKKKLMEQRTPTMIHAQKQ